MFFFFCYLFIRLATTSDYRVQCTYGNSIIWTIANDTYLMHGVKTSGGKWSFHMRYHSENIFFLIFKLKHPVVKIFKKSRINDSCCRCFLQRTLSVKCPTSCFLNRKSGNYQQPYLQILSRNLYDHIVFNI